MKDLKSHLLSPETVAYPSSIIGHGCYLFADSRPTNWQILKTKPRNFVLRAISADMALAGASLVLNSLVDEKGLPAQDLPAPDELMKSHSYASLIEALTKVQRHSYGTLEEAKKN